MSEAVIVAIISGVCTLIGSFGGVMATSSLTAYRIKKLEEQVNKHNQVIERTYKLEGRVTEVEHEVRDLKEYHRP